MLGVRRRRLEDKIGGERFGLFLVQDLRQRWHFEVRYPVRVIRVFDGGGERTKVEEGWL